MRRLRQTDDYPWLKYLGAVVFGLLICIVVCLLRKIFEQTDTATFVITGKANITLTEKLLEENGIEYRRI